MMIFHDNIHTPGHQTASRGHTVPRRLGQVDICSVLHLACYLLRRRGKRDGERERGRGKGQDERVEKGKREEWQKRESRGEGGERGKR